MAIPAAAEKAATVLAKEGFVRIYTQLRGHFAATVDDLAEGSVVCQDLSLNGAFEHSGLNGTFEHSGIHVGGYKVVSLDGSGEIKEEGTRAFLDGGYNRFIWVSCRGGAAVGKPSAAKRAREMVGQTREYNPVLDNCHQFTSGCLTGDFESADNAFTFLKMTVERVLGADNWRVWDRDGAIQRMCEGAIREISRDRHRLQKLIAADFDERKKLLGASFDRLATSYAIKDVNGFLDGLAAIANAYGGKLPWQDFESFDAWMLDDDAALKL